MPMMETKKPLVVLTDYKYDSLAPFQEVYDRARVDFRACQCKSEKEIIDACRDADAVQVHFAQITREVIEALPKCRIIVRSAVGMDNIDVAAAAEAGIPVCNVPDYGIEDVSTHAILLMLAVTKKLNLLTDSVQRGVWDYAVVKPVHRICDQVFALMGCGAIARCAARKAQAFGMKVIAYDPYLKQEQVEDLGIRLVGMEEAARQGDVISVHLPLTEQTAGLLDLKFFSQMKKGAYLINTARGGVINEGDLAAALKKGMIAGAGLDVLCEEKISRDHPLLGLDNVILTPHAAWYSEEAEHTLLTSAAEEVVRGLKGEQLRKPFNGICKAREIRS